MKSVSIKNIRVLKLVTPVIFSLCFSWSLSRFFDLCPPPPPPLVSPNPPGTLMQSASRCMNRQKDQEEKNMRRALVGLQLVASLGRPDGLLGSSTVFNRFGIDRRGASASFSGEASRPKRPHVELEFIGPEPEGNRYPVDLVKVESGSKVLRDVMLDNNIDLYASFRKVVNCRGRGLCGTCVVEIVEGQDLLSERSKAEIRHLSKKPESWRLACQTKVGNSFSSGKVVVQTQPQLKK